MKFTPFFFGIVSLLFVEPIVRAQDTKVVSDYRMTAELEASVGFLNKWHAIFGSSIWFEKNVTHLDEVNFDLELEYDLFKFMSLGAGYRLTENKKLSGEYVLKQRYNFDLGFDYKIRRFKVDYRLRYQNIDDDFFQYDVSKPADNILRNRLQVKYNIQKIRITPYTYVEHYGVLYSEDPYSLKIKWLIGARYSLGKYGKLKGFYRIDKELNNEHPYTYFNLGFGYEYEF